MNTEQGKKKSRVKKIRVRKTVDYSRNVLNKMMDAPDEEHYEPISMKEFEEEKFYEDDIRPQRSSNAAVNSSDFHRYRFQRRNTQIREAMFRKEEEKERAVAEFERVEQINRHKEQLRAAKNRRKKKNKQTKQTYTEKVENVDEKYEACDIEDDILNELKKLDPDNI